jgi:tetratricopeptide (TPR) repeat protein
MEQWKNYFTKGKNSLAQHKPKEALKLLSQSLKLCPPDKLMDSSNILYYIGIAFERLGFFSNAIRFWISANRIKKQRRIQKIIKRYANGYGMVKQTNDDLDDRNAFYAIQIRRYLEKKHNRIFSTDAERDVIIELVSEYWRKLAIKVLIDKKTISQKRNIFLNVQIPFPYLFKPKCMGDSVLSVNFKNIENIASPTRCFCGSGLVFTMCCGRTPDVEDVFKGVF